MFDITDPFGTRRIENLERELRRQKCAMQGEIEYYREKALEQGAVSHHLCQVMERDYKSLHETKAEKDRLSQLLKVCEEARKSLTAQNRSLTERLDRLLKDFDQLSEELDSKKRELEEIYAKHDALIKDLQVGTSESLEVAD